MFRRHKFLEGGLGMSSINVSFLGEEYYFPSDLIDFIKILRFFDSFHAQLNPLLLRLMEKEDWEDGTERGQQYFKKTMVQQANKVIAKLSSCNIYDITVSDLVDNNPGFIQIIETGNNTLEAMKNILSNTISNWLEGYDNAQNATNSQITGMGFSIWTNSLTSALVYSAMEARTIKQQQTKAQKEYQTYIRKLNQSTNDNKKKQENELLRTYYYPRIAEAFEMFVNYMMTTFIQKLDENGIIYFSSIRYETFN